jgi:hypothetical protein
LQHSSCMAETKHKHGRLALDLLVLAPAVALVILSLKLGLHAGQPATKGGGVTLGGIYLIYLGLLFLLSYFFPEACHVFSFMQYLSNECSRPRSRHMTLFYSGLGLVIGAWLLLIGLGVF